MGLTGKGGKIKARREGEKNVVWARGAFGSWVGLHTCCYRERCGRYKKDGIKKMKKSVQSRKWEKIVGEENNDSIICRNIRCYNVSDASSFMCYLLKCVSEKYQTDRCKEIERKQEKQRKMKRKV